ncbi:MAG: tyrosine-type recombinase/integrase [Thermodesulfobacteriota bacterium]|nr:tyrosine-type recombinase/integrase [Thermodesulfobacteriota bacterium]
MLEDKIKSFIAYCKVAGFKDKSLETFSLRLNEFNKFLNSKRFRSIQSVNYSHLSAFVSDFKSPSVHIKKARIWSLHQFFHFLKLKGHIKDNIAMDLPYPKIEKTIPHFLTIDEYNRILLYCSADSTHIRSLRNLIIIMMLGMLGLRTNTIISMNIQDVDIVTGLAWVKDKGYYFQRTIVMPKLICATLQRYFDLLRKYQGPLFLSKRGNQISPRTLQDIFRTIATSCGIDKHLHAHLFRHTAATHLNRVAGTTITQQILGHSLNKNTYKYTHLHPDYYATYMKKIPL